MKVMGMIQMKRVTTREMVMRTTKTAKSITANGVMETNQSRFKFFSNPHLLENFAVSELFIIPKADGKIR